MAMMLRHTPSTLKLKPELAMTAQRWEASFAREMIDRPPVWVTLPKPDASYLPADYSACLHDEIDTVVANALSNARNTRWLADSIPQWRPDFGCDTVTAITGLADLYMNDDSPDTVWARPLVTDWARALPIYIQPENHYWKRLLAFYQRAEEIMAGELLLRPPDLHTGLGLLAAARGAEALCLDMVECPELIDRAIQDAHDLFKDLWRMISAAARMDVHGYSDNFYSRDGAAMLECDVSCLISPSMFQRWVLPELEWEISIVKHATYHWDGPQALVHAGALYGIRDLYAMSYVPGAGNGPHAQHLPLLREMQAAGKVAHVAGTIDEIKYLHSQLKHNLIVYFPSVETVDEVEELLEWLIKNS
jgi:hypothetical protein